MFQQENQGCGQLGYSTKEKKQKNKKNTLSALFV